MTTYAHTPEPPGPPSTATPVLLVDEDPVICSTLSTLLQSAGYHVACVPSEADALEYLRGAMAPHVVLLAFFRSLLTCSGLLRQAQDDATLRQHCYLLVTDQDLERLPAEERHLMANICFDVLTKPLDAFEVIAAVTQAAAQLPATA